MGFLSDGQTLKWEDSKKHIDYIKKHGILQFLSIYKKVKDRKNDCLKWGDEIEYIVVRMDPERKQAQLLLRTPEILNELLKLENPDVSVLWRPEYGSYMLEGTPGKPFAGVNDIRILEGNMRYRREEVQKYLRSNEILLSVPVFPRSGCPGCTYPSHPPGGDISKSLFLPDAIINPHKRFGTLTANIRERRGNKVDINIPLYQDTNTHPDAGEAHYCSSHDNHHSHNHEYEQNNDVCSGHVPRPYNIYMDAMGFGMGLCCLQCTFQCCNIDEARFFYDQLGILSPIMLALTAGTPMFRGLLADTDVRWSVISQSVDDRTPEELGKTANGNTSTSQTAKKHAIPKSRYDSISTFISPEPSLLPRYNDLEIPIDADSYTALLAADVDPLLARHLAHLFIRDPLVIYDSKIAIDDEHYSDHFENIQSTNWQTVRFKPPPPDSSIGWRVEFRPMEIQVTDFENAAFVAFVVLLNRVISSFELNFYLPISLVDENMQIAHKRDAVNTEKFHFRKNITADSALNEAEVVKMSIDEIMNGKAGEFVGLIPMIRLYLASSNVENTTKVIIDKYLSLISKRASGELYTLAGWMRKFVTSHAAYNKDSVVSEEIAYDLLDTCRKIGEGSVRVPELMGDFL